jgi:hypothetical protein
MGGKDWTVPPLTLGQLRRFLPKIRSMTTIDASGLTDDQIDTMAEVVAAALVRNYPDTTAEVVLDLLDMGNARTVLDAVLTGSGLRPAAPGEAPARGTNGTSYTASSPTSADIPSQP